MTVETLLESVPMAFGSESSLRSSRLRYVPRHCPPSLSLEDLELGADPAGEIFKSIFKSSNASRIDLRNSACASTSLRTDAFYGSGERPTLDLLLVVSSLSRCPKSTKLLPIFVCIFARENAQCVPILVRLSRLPLA